MKNALLGILGFLKRLFLANLGLKALSLFLAFHIYFLVRPSRQADGGGEPEAAPSLLTMPQAAVTVTAVTVTNTVTIVTNMVEVVRPVSAPDAPPAQDASAPAADGGERTGGDGR